jgi:hypothetical protein
MKLLPTLTLATLFVAGAAFAATTPTATPATTATPAASTMKHDAASCEKEAKEKKLAGAEKDKFMKDCKAGKKAD